MKLAIVGPGLMEIPPKGWGAVEIVIYEYSIEMKRLGWDVSIINSSNRQEIIGQVNDFDPDFVHIHYDEYGSIARNLDCQSVAVTSHFGYLDQVWAFPGYQEKIHRPIVEDDHLHVFALSPSIADVYISDGKPAEKVHVLPNGVRTSTFRVTDAPSLVSRSICLGKIEPRKQQGLLQSMELGIDFVGNIGNVGGSSPFDVSSSSYLGAWTKEDVYGKLTEYANLVLLSDGEAHPLVVSEALSAGLGVVVSDAAAANLDRSLPFIATIPRDRITDVRYVAETIKKNRAVSVGMRSQIVDYAKTFDWSVAAHKFDNAIRSVLTTRSEPTKHVAPKRRVAVLTIATGGYFDTFFDELAASISDRFCKDASVEIFCFTDRETGPRQGVIFVKCPRLGWPFDTLLRFHRFKEISDDLRAFDLVVYMDADMRVERDVLSSELWHDFFAVEHPGYLPPASLRGRILRSNLPSYEIYRGSSAFVEADSKSTYVQGCFFGGKRVPFLYMIDKLCAWTSTDLRRGEVPVWHDESFLNRFMHAHEHVIIPYTFAYPEGWLLPRAPTILHRQKKHTILRGEAQDDVDVTRILEGDREILNNTYHRLYLRSHEKVQKLEFYLRALQNLRLSIAWQVQQGIQAPMRLARRIKRSLLK